MLHKEIPFLRIGLPLCAGIITGLSINPGPGFYIITSFFIITGFCSSLFFNKQLTNILFGISLTLALWVAGLTLYTLEKGRISDLDPEEAVYKGILDDMPEEKEKSWKMIIRLKGVIYNNSLISKGGSILVYHRKDEQLPQFLPGDELIIRCSPVKITNMGNPGEFDYRFYMETQGIKYYAFTQNDDILIHSRPDGRKLRHNALIIREKILDMFLERGVSQENLGLVAAMTLGQKNLLDPEQKQYFMKAGVMHIMAVSGLHTVILSLFIFNILFFLKGKLNIVRVLITLLALWAFAFITGLTPSVLRATLMFSFLQTGKIIKRPVNAINSILASAFILILLKPSVIFEAGFLLSYSAVIFIICFYRDLYLKIRFIHRIPDLIWQSAAVTIIAQAGTLPLTVMLFNRFPVWFILSNIIIVPLSSLVVITGVMVIIFWPVPFLSGLIARILEFLTSLTETLTWRAASLPLSTIENIGITGIECILLTITLFLFCRYLLDRKSIPVIYPLTALLFFMAAGTIHNITIKRSGEIIVYNTIGHTTVGIRTGRILNYYSDNLIEGKEVSRHRAMFRLKGKQNKLERPACLTIGGKNKILITDSPGKPLPEQFSPDVVVFTGTGPLTDRNTDTNGKLKALIIVNALPQRSGISSVYADTLHFVRTSGAFYHKL